MIPTHNTVVALNFCRGVIERGGGALDHSFEMNRRKIIKRLFAHYSGIENWKIQRGRLTDFEKDEVYRASELLFGKKLWVRDFKGSWPQHMAAYEAAIRMHPEIEMVVVDYLGLIRGIPGERERHLQLATVTSDLKDLAGRMNVLCVGLAQFNRKTTEQERPTLENFRESGALEQDCDIAILLFAPKAQENKTMGYVGWEPLIFDIAKHRDGNVGSFEAYYDRRYCRIVDMPAEEVRPQVIAEKVEAATVEEEDAALL